MLIFCFCLREKSKRKLKKQREKDMAVTGHGKATTTKRKQIFGLTLQRLSNMSMIKSLKILRILFFLRLLRDKVSKKFKKWLTKTKKSELLMKRSSRRMVVMNGTSKLKKIKRREKSLTPWDHPLSGTSAKMTARKKSLTSSEPEPTQSKATRTEELRKSRRQSPWSAWICQSGKKTSGSFWPSTTWKSSEMSTSCTTPNLPKRNLE